MVHIAPLNGANAALAICDPPKKAKATRTSAIRTSLVSSTGPGLRMIKRNVERALTTPITTGKYEIIWNNPESLRMSKPAADIKATPDLLASQKGPFRVFGIKSGVKGCKIHQKS
ncbi:hypothetical protein BPAE_0081g00430 [Botrytis paeoniae]|uniref:Uncharacterized protein n=1 Tax=Botrytis paeoniae TaxID=278948 RepID=A0A4Z1FQY8_9HELO|nr:hypothetical protein BPAE_0081g00430 [Botrytis paeoniae]